MNKIAVVYWSGTGNWEAQCRELGAAIASEPVTCANQPEEDTLAACKNLGAALA